MTCKGTCLVAGAGGFIGGWLVKQLIEEGFSVRAIDIKHFKDWWQVHTPKGVQNFAGVDLRLRDECMNACRGGIDYVYNLAADMGGIGFIELNKAACMLSVLINTHMLMAAEFHGAKRYLYTSSACVYAADKQNRSNLRALKETDAYPAVPEDGYGWEKLFSERMCRHFTEDYGLETRVVRIHNCYGPHGSWNDGREKAPAALCRKVAEAKLLGARLIEVWGNGRCTRSFMYISDCIKGIRRVMDSVAIKQPINLGSSELVSIEGLLALVEEAADYKVSRDYVLNKPQGVQGRNSDNTLILEELGWCPNVELAHGIKQTYDWVEQCVTNR